ncbi:MAG TPA: hypothetical protein VFV66_02995 [Nonomuraea sp.]|nr:hypothetical protein [Nonomuraea sp.]
MGLFFWARRARWRARAVRQLLVRLAVPVVAAVIAIATGQFLAALVVTAAAVVIALFIVGAFTTDWRNAHVTVNRQYRRLQKRGQQ